jgi:hypothetical protein
MDPSLCEPQCSGRTSLGKKYSAPNLSAEPKITFRLVMQSRNCRNYNDHPTQLYLQRRTSSPGGTRYWQNADCQAEEEIELVNRRWMQGKRTSGRAVPIRLNLSRSDRVSKASQIPDLRYFCLQHNQDGTLFVLIGELERAAGFNPRRPVEFCWIRGIASIPLGSGRLAEAPMP